METRQHRIIVSLAWIGTILLFVIVLPHGSWAAPQGNAIVPGQIQMDATYNHLGAVWWITGDDDLDSSLTLEFRRLGDSIWNPGAPAMRAYPTIFVQDGPLGLNYWGASALFLEPGTTYEVRLTLTDPDGGGTAQIVQATTRTWPKPDPAGRELFVVPGSGGGDGSAGDPFKGLQAAADAAIPGDVFSVDPGTYASFEILASGTPGHPIVFQGSGQGLSVIDGAGTSAGVVTIGKYNQTIRHIILAGFSIQNGHWGIDAQHSQELYIHHNLIQDVDDGIVNRRGDALEANQVVCDNTILGLTPWPGTGIPSERGVDLKGTGNVVCRNTVRYFGDCISVQPSTGPSFGNDVYGNDASYCVDDGIEVDYNQANVRVWRNRVMNARMGISVQPIRGGPAYLFRNEFFNLESVPVKMHNSTTGFFVVHNTGAKHVNGHGDNGAMWRNAVFRNNLFLGTRYAFEFTTVPDEGFRDFDYNAWGTTREIEPGGPYFKWDNVRYDFIDDLPPGVEDHGIEALFSHLADAALPSWWNVAAEPGTRQLQLVPGAPAINAGTAVANFNDPFVFDGQPDMGAFEFGEPLPEYGPLPQLPDLSGSYKLASIPAPAFGDEVDFTIVLSNSGAPLTGTLHLTDTIPTGLAYLPGSLAASSGTVSAGLSPILTWDGNLDASPITITYATTVTAVAPTVIANQAYVTDGVWIDFTLQAWLIPNGQQLWMPVLVKE